MQRVALGLFSALAGATRPITYDPYARQWRGLESWELRGLSAAPPVGEKRGAHWPWEARWRGRARRATQALARREFALPGERVGNGDLTAELAETGGLIVPEIFSAEVGAALPWLLAEVEGPSVAIFHDAIALRLPELAAPKTVARFPAYLRELAQFDGIAAVSEASRAELLGYWEWAGIWDTPPVTAIPLGVERMPAPVLASPKPGEGRLHLLCVGSIEGRKNHLALLQACESLWQRGLQFDLHLIGLAQRQTGAEALALIEKLQAAGRPLRYDGVVGDEAREAAYAAADFTVYPSLAEGFGLPVAESLVRGKPCICSADGALGETAAGGGCLTVAEPTAAMLAEACAGLIEDPRKLAELTAAAERRVFASPSDHANRLVQWMESLGS